MGDQGKLRVHRAFTANVHNSRIEVLKANVQSIQEAIAAVEDVRAEVVEGVPLVAHISGELDGNNQAKQDAVAWFRAGELCRAKRMCANIIDYGILSPRGVNDPLFEAAITQLLIGLNDLLQKAKTDDKRISLVEHVQVTAERQDVTDLIRECRNAACHISTGLHDLGTNKFTFNF